MTNRPRSLIAAEQIAAMIESDQLRPGEKLAEEMLAENLGMSRLPVREGLRVLAREGLVEIRPRRGAFVAALGPPEVAELYDIRALLEGHAAGRAAMAIGPAELRRLSTVVDEMRDGVRAHDITRYTKLNVEFHRILWQNSDKGLLGTLLGQLWRRGLKYRFISLRLPGRLEASLNYHEHLFFALSSHDPELAERTTWLSIQDAKLALLRDYFGEKVTSSQRAELGRGLPQLNHFLLDESEQVRDWTAEANGGRKRPRRQVRRLARS